MRTSPSSFINTQPEPSPQRWPSDQIGWVPADARGRQRWQLNSEHAGDGEGAGPTQSSPVQSKSSPTQPSPCGSRSVPRNACSVPSGLASPKVVVQVPVPVQLSQPSHRQGARSRSGSSSGRKTNLGTLGCPETGVVGGRPERLTTHPSLIWAVRLTAHPPSPACDPGDACSVRLLRTDALEYPRTKVSKVPEGLCTATATATMPCPSPCPCPCPCWPMWAFAASLIEMPSSMLPGE